MLKLIEHLALVVEHDDSLFLTDRDTFMEPRLPESPKPETSEMERLASDSDPGLIAEFGEFVRHEGKWWLIPIVAVLLLLGILAFLSTTGLAPFIYPVF